MEFRGAFRVVRRGDIGAPPRGLRPLLGRGAPLDVRRFAGPSEPPGPRILVNAPRRAGSAVQRNRFRRRVRMAFLRLLREEDLRLAPEAIVWVRPSAACDLAFETLLDHLRRALRTPV